MGLFSSLVKIAGPVLGTVFGGPVGGALGTALSGALTAKSAKNTVNNGNAAAQVGIDNGLNALNSQFANTTASFQPYQTVGTQALGGQSNLLGLNGAGAQGSAIAGLQSSPLFQSLFRQGQDTILNNASATGGLRGGNVQSSLANFGSDTLSQVIQQQLANLSPLTQMGFNATSQLGSLGANNANAISSLYGQSGTNNAGSILKNGQIGADSTQGIQNLFSNGSAGGNGLSSILGGLFGSGGGINPAINTSNFSPISALGYQAPSSYQVSIPQTGLPF